MEIAFQQHLQQLIPVQLADQGAGAVVVGDVGGILAENIAHDLVDGVIALFLQGTVDGGQDGSDFLVLISADAEFACVVDVAHRAHPPFL